MTGYPEVSLSDLIESATSGFASGAKDPAGVVQIRMNNLETDGSWNWAGIRRIPSAVVKSPYYVRKGDILFNSTNSPKLVGKSAYFQGFPEPIVFSNHFVRLRTNPQRLDGRYLARWLNLLWKQRIFEAGCIQWVNQATYRKEDLLALQVPLPPLPEQKRIAGILDATDALRARRREALAQLDTLLQSTFLDMFGDPVTNPKGWDETLRLGDLSDIVSGITKGRKANAAALREVPYLAVSNVQDRSLSLDVVKTISATEGEIARYSLRPGDLLLTEGGDPDKLGRGTLWNGEIAECIHQNHVFRVRVHDPMLHPTFLNWIVGSRRGKSYFLRSAKQTTGIASINMRQLKAFPLLVPPLDLQQRFATIVESLERQKALMRAHLVELDSLFASLQSRAFSGTL
jgi:type I restriction enzyme, S subunit